MGKNGAEKHQRAFQQNKIHKKVLESKKQKKKKKTLGRHGCENENIWAKKQSDRRGGERGGRAARLEWKVNGSETDVEWKGHQLADTAMNGDKHPSADKDRQGNQQTLKVSSWPQTDAECG